MVQQNTSCLENDLPGRKKCGNSSGGVALAHPKESLLLVRNPSPRCEAHCTAHETTRGKLVSGVGMTYTAFLTVPVSRAGNRSVTMESCWT
jgi:hypothetical protein